MARTRHLGRQFGKDALLHDEDGKSWIETRQDIDPLVKLASIMAESGELDKDFTRVAIIDRVTLDRAFNEGWFHDEDAWRKWYEQNPHLHTTTRYKTI
jgi:hypothetical protein